jgi:hypothetical protein
MKLKKETKKKKKKSDNNIRRKRNKDLLQKQLLADGQQEALLHLQVKVAGPGARALALAIKVLLEDVRVDELQIQRRAALAMRRRQEEANKKTKKEQTKPNQPKQPKQPKQYKKQNKTNNK